LTPSPVRRLQAIWAASWPVGVDLNAAVLNDLKRGGYVVHMVVIFGAGKDGFWLHYPGLMPRSNRQVSRRKLASAWFWSRQKNAGLVAVKRA
jgi:hypothetical protein